MFGAVPLSPRIEPKALSPVLVPPRVSVRAEAVSVWLTLAAVKLMVPAPVLLMAAPARISMARLVVSVPEPVKVKVAPLSTILPEPLPMEESVSAVGEFGDLRGAAHEGHGTTESVCGVGKGKDLSARSF